MASPFDCKKLALLTPNQRRYLTLVGQGYTSKQIAQTVAGSHHTINVEIGIAMRLLGATNRKQAASFVQQAEASYERSYEPKTIESDQLLAATSDALRAIDDRSWPLPIATDKRPFNSLTIAQRVFWILAIAAGTALLLGGLAIGVMALLRAAGT